ncbi:unnamed protein product, partial [Amoebophrya sp. A120]|eukprot:GSA120T00021763001.1
MHKVLGIWSNILLPSIYFPQLYLQRQNFLPVSKITFACNYLQHLYDYESPFHRRTFCKTRNATIAAPLTATSSSRITTHRHHTREFLHRNKIRKLQRKTMGIIHNYQINSHHLVSVRFNISHRVLVFYLQSTRLQLHRHLAQPVCSVGREDPLPRRAKPLG